MSSFTNFFKKIFSAKFYFKSLSIYSDVEILEVVHQKGLISTKKLSQTLEISWLDASHRLETLQRRGALKMFYDVMGGNSYTLKEEIDDFSFLRDLYSGEINEETILQLSEECNGQAQPVHLCIMANIPMKEAKKHFKFFKKKGILSTVYTTHWQVRYVLTNTMTSNRNKLAAPKSQRKKLQIGNPIIQDSEIIKLAIQSKGKLSATSLCLKKEIEVDLAQQVLNNLQERHVFDIHVNNNGTIEYWLNDKSLLE